MNDNECIHEQGVVNAVLSGRWPAVDEDLSAHVAHCATCREVADVAVVLRADHNQARADVHVPVAGQVWWRSAVRARLESAQAATRPMTWLHGVTAAITIGVMLALLGTAWPVMVDLAVWTRDIVVPLMTNAGVSGAVGGVLRQSALIAVGAAACLLVAPVLLYFVLSND
ncbi:MAG: hypothetical protein AB7P34_14455 [Vicinamibacterales bacterium]